MNFQDEVVGLTTVLDEGEWANALADAERDRGLADVRRGFRPYALTNEQLDMVVTNLGPVECEDCGEEIPTERVRAILKTQYRCELCVDCKSMQE